MPTLMLFVFESEGRHRFYMWQTPMPLDIAFFAADGTLVGSAAMTAVPRTFPGRLRAGYTPGRAGSSWQSRCPPGGLDSLGLEPGARISRD